MRTGILISIVICGALSATHAYAQERGRDINIPSGVSTVPVELLPPGARALGLAGAFTAVADDATAAEANPAGLTILSAPEVSIHFRDSDYNVPFYDAEARNAGAFGGPTGTLIQEYEDSNTNLSFASVVYPWERFVFSAFYTNNLDINAAAPSDARMDTEFLDTFISENALRGELDGYGVSAAFRLNDTISLGLTIKNTDLSIRTVDRQIIEDFRDLEFAFAEITGLGSPADFAGVIVDELTVESNLNGSDSDTHFNLGLLFNPGGNFSAGLVYKKGGSYEISGQARFQDVLGCTGSGELTDICNLGLEGVAGSNTQSMSTLTEVSIPDTLTLGLAWRPGIDDTWLVSFDVANIDYGDLPPPRRTTLGFEFPVDGSANALADDIEPISDAVTYHLGVEKVFFPGMDWVDIFTLRAGAFTDDDHDGTRLVDSDDTHGTLGAGAVFGNFQVDMAAEFSDRVDNLVVSGIYRF